MSESSPIWLMPLQGYCAELRSPEPGEKGLVRLRLAIAEVESLLSQYRAEMPAELVHFLERRSYEKAAQYCQGGLNITRGSCGARN